MVKVIKSEEFWRQRLSPLAYRVTREGATEAPFSGTYADCHQAGCYACACCDAPLFQSTSKYDSGSGWPSFWSPVTEQALVQTLDSSHGMTRVEVRCATCDAHLGHVFPDGPEPSGQRYCINSIALILHPDTSQQNDQHHQNDRQGEE